MAVVEISLDKLKIHPKNVRKEYEGIDELAQSIKENGIMQNLTVVPDPDEEGKYLVVIGNRRLTAARKAGIRSAPCSIIEGMCIRDQVTTMLTENMNRKDLKIYEEAAAIQMCFSDYGLGIDELEQKTGLSKTTINHRLNIAKLDENVLIRRAKNEEFQLTLTDLYALEKVKDIKTRNKILKEARDSRDISCRARVAVREELVKEHKKEFIALCKAMGITPAPDKVVHELYSAKWEVVKKFYLPESVPKKLAVKNKKKNLMYTERYDYFYIIKKAETKKTRQEIEQNNIKRNQREHRAMYRQMFEDMGDFIRGIYDGSIAPVKDEAKIDGMIWNLYMAGPFWMERKKAINTLLSKDMYSFEITDKIRKEAEEKVSALPIISQKIGVAYWNVEELHLMERSGIFAQSAGERLQLLYEILAEYGFSWREPEFEQIMNGTHRLYKKA